MPGLDHSFDLAEIVEHLREGLQVLGPDGTYLYLNAAAAAHGQRTAGDLLGRRITEAYPGIDQTQMYRHLRRVLEEGGAHQMENEFVYPDGSKRWFELRMTRIRQGVLVLSIDVTHRKQLEARMHRADRMDAVGQLAGGVAHDFNNLLTIIQAHAGLIEEGAKHDPAILEDLAAISDASRRGADLTRKLLTFAGQLPVGPRAVPVGEALGNLDHLLRRALGQGVVLETHVGESVAAVWMDPTAFDQVFLNLAINARDAMPEGGNLTVEAEPITLTDRWNERHGVSIAPGEHVVISVTDTGTGISPALLDRVFEPFFSTKEGTGTGLGLATCWGLVSQAGGAITVYSEVGTGTTFRVYLPKADRDADELRTSDPAPARAAGAFVMVVEDEPVVRAVIARILRAEGYRVVEVTSPAEALLLAEDIGDRIDLLLTDVVMPRVSGLELADRMRRRFPALRVLVMSGFAPKALARDGHVVPGVPFLSKPFAPEALLAAVARALC